MFKCFRTLQHSAEQVFLNLLCSCSKSVRYRCYLWLDDWVNQSSISAFNATNKSDLLFLFNKRTATSSTRTEECVASPGTHPLGRTFLSPVVPENYRVIGQKFEVGVVKSALVFDVKYERSLFSFLPPREQTPLFLWLMCQALLQFSHVKVKWELLLSGFNRALSRVRVSSEGVFHLF